jgi:hypothetical protein
LFPRFFLDGCDWGVMTTATLSRGAKTLSNASEDELRIKTRVINFLERRAAPIGQMSAVAAPATPGNIIGVGIGARESGGAINPAERALRVYVRVKVPRRDLSDAETLPKEFDGMPVDVIEAGDVIQHDAVPSGHRQLRLRPIPAGVSIGRRGDPLPSAGTLGAFASRGKKVFILSNNHVLAANNHGTTGDPIVQPGPLDGDSGDPPVARLRDFEPIIFGGGANAMDAAIAEVEGGVLTDTAIAGVGSFSPKPMASALNQSVMKHGRTTGLTLGIVSDVTADVNVDVAGRIGRFVGQIAIRSASHTPFSSGGDSGSLVLDAVSRRPVGLLFAGSVMVTFANPISLVLRRFRVRLMP